MNFYRQHLIKINSLFFLLIIAGLTYTAIANSAGKTGNTDGCSCHGSANSSTKVTLTSGSGSFTFEAGSTTSFTVAIDNSSMSKDSRLFDYDARPLNGVFSHRYAVREQDLIGRALYIFWPHGIPFLNDGKGIAVRYHKEPPRQQGWAPSNLDADEYPSVRVPFYPNVGRMKKIR